LGGHWSWSGKCRRRRRRRRRRGAAMASCCSRRRWCFGTRWATSEGRRQCLRRRAIQSDPPCFLATLSCFETQAVSLAHFRQPRSGRLASVQLGGGGVCACRGHFLAGSTAQRSFGSDWAVVRVLRRGGSASSSGDGVARVSRVARGISSLLLLLSLLRLLWRLLLLLLWLLLRSVSVLLVGGGQLSNVGL
jgi:hypothetical protein